jgi:hypothetical protein
MKRFPVALFGLSVTVAALAGCAGSSAPAPVITPATVTASATDEVAQERAKLAPAERALVETQEWCVVQTDERLGSMGAPIKLDIKGQPVFVCCKSCKRKAEADPDATLAKVAELKAKKKKENK